MGVLWMPYEDVTGMLADDAMIVEFAFFEVDGVCVKWSALAESRIPFKHLCCSCENTVSVST